MLTYHVDSERAAREMILRCGSLRFFALHLSPRINFIRLGSNGPGLCWVEKTMPMTFSERNGYVNTWTIGDWRFKRLARAKKQRKRG